MLDIAHFQNISRRHIALAPDQIISPHYTESPGYKSQRLEYVSERFPADVLSQSSDNRKIAEIPVVIDWCDAPDTKTILGTDIDDFDEYPDDYLYEEGRGERNERSGR